MLEVHSRCRAGRRHRQTSSGRAKRPCVCQSSIGWDSEIRYPNGAASMQAHRRLVPLADLLAMDPLKPDESVRHDGGACCQTGLPCGFCLNTIARTGCFISCPLPARKVVLPFQPTGRGARLRCGHLFLLACGCLVARRSMLGDWIQSSRSDHAVDGHSR